MLVNINIVYNNYLFNVMKKILLYLFLVLTSIAYAKNIDPETAKNAAVSFLNQLDNNGFKSAKLYTLNQLYIETDHINNSLKSAVFEEPPYYLYDINNGQGFILMSGNDLALPVLGYSLQNRIQTEAIPDAFKEMLDQFRYEVEYAKSNSVNFISNQEKWSQLLNGNEVNKEGSYAPIPPLLTTKWNQSPYYNAMCPVNDKGQKAITGCVATAMAQVMNHHEFPSRGQSFYDYIANNFGLQSLIFANHSYNWNVMPDVLNGSSTNNEIDEVAKLMYHCGVGVSMNYGVSASGSTMNRLANALRNYFSYNPNLNVKYMNAFSPENWIDSIYLELQNNRPLLYAGFGTSSGHAFIIDGYEYNEGDKFHINWGWGGYNDGYFALTALNPGAFSAGFNYYQHGIFGVSPNPAYEEWQIEFLDDITFSSDTLYTNSPYNITINIKNKGAKNLTGDLAAFIFDQDSAMIQYAGYKWNDTINSGDSMVLIFSNSYLSVPAGNYTVGIFYKGLKNNWVPVNDGMYQNFKQINVIESDSISSFILSDSIVFTPTVPVFNDSLNIECKIKNRSSKVFNGKIKVKLYNMWGNLLSEVDSTDILSIVPDSIFNVYFKLDTILFEPGKYYLSLFECPSGSVNEFKINAAAFLNPKSLTILPQAPVGDKFENNDSLEIAQPLEVNFSTNYFYKYYDSLSIHTDQDIDFFKIGFPNEAYVYHFNMYTYSNSNRDKEGTNQQYEQDGILTLQFYDGYSWSEPITQQTSTPITAYPGDTLWIKIFPYFTGLTTDYTMNISVSRTVITKSNVTPYSDFEVYPTLFDNHLSFSTGKDIEMVEVYKLNGQMQYSANSKSKIYTSNWEAGVYIVMINFKDNTSKKYTVIKQ